ncbi:MAG: T9SS type A sorting domain-containing protein [Calditrichaeota bacterium]|nr:T9SS type A sorting domain-containing protein [Calditrichota bacterium]
MTRWILFTLFISFTLLNALKADTFIFVNYGQDNELIITIDSSMHQDYGFSYPLTYQLGLPGNSDSLKAEVRFSKTRNWQMVFPRSSDDFFNAKWAARFEYAENKAFVSVGFSNISDSIFIRIVNNKEETVPVSFEQIPRFYDNRVMAVNVSADDMAEWSKLKFWTSIKYTRERNLWLTLAINPASCNSNTWDFLQDQLNKGLIEAGSHSSTHPKPKPYDDYEYEVLDSKHEITKNLSLPNLFRNGSKEYVYSYIAPHGYTDAVIDSLVGAGKYLLNRLYYPNFFGFSEWDEKNNSFKTIGVSRAMDPPKEQLGWGIGTNNIDTLNAGFDKALREGSVYYLMFHPNVVEWNKSYTLDHLDYISERKDVWYVALGHLYLYRLAQTNYESPTGIARNPVTLPDIVEVFPNYPNPFNPATTIRYRLKQTVSVSLLIYNPLGQLVDMLINQRQAAGYHQVKWVANNLPSGNYFYLLKAGNQVKSGKIVKVK